MDYWINELYHHGILGQKWGIRRYQNPDGTLTPAGRERYGKSVIDQIAKAQPSEHYTDVIKKIRNNPDLKKVARLVKDYAKESSKASDRVKELENAFASDTDLYDKYAKKALDKNVKEGLSINGMSNKEALEWFKKELDGFSDVSNTFEEFRASNEPLAKKLNAAYENDHKAFDSLMNACEKYADEILSNCKDMSIQITTAIDKTKSIKAKRIVTMALRDESLYRYGAPSYQWLKNR